MVRSALARNFESSARGQVERFAVVVHFQVRLGRQEQSGRLVADGQHVAAEVVQRLALLAVQERQPGQRVEGVGRVTVQGQHAVEGVHRRAPLAEFFQHLAAQHVNADGVDGVFVGLERGVEVVERRLQLVPAVEAAPSW